MFSNVGMNPYGPGGVVVTSQSPAPTAPGTDTASATRGETGASRVRPDTVQAVDPPRQATPAASLPEGPGTEGSAGLSVSQRLAELAARFTPQPEVAATERAAAEDAAASGPAGPPPAFRRSLLEAQRAETIGPDPAPATISAPEPPDRAARRAEPGSRVEEAGETLVTPPPGTAEDIRANDSTEGPVDTGDPLLATIRRIMDDERAAGVPPSAEARAEADFSGLRRMETPYDTATVDILR